MNRREDEIGISMEPGVDKPFHFGGISGDNSVLKVVMVGPDGRPIPHRLTQDIVDAAVARMSNGRVGGISAWDPLQGEGVPHGLIVTLTNLSKRGAVAVAAPYAMSMALESPIGTDVYATWGTSVSGATTGTLAPNGSVAPVWTFTPTYPPETSGTSVPGRATATAVLGNPGNPGAPQVTVSAIKNFVINVILTEYGATIVITEV